MNSSEQDLSDLPVKRILILTNDAGFGHRKASNAIRDALKELYPRRCEVEIVNPLDDPSAPGVLRDSQMDYDRLVREMPDMYKLRYEISDTPVPATILESVVTVMLYRLIDKTLREVQPDAVISTHPIFPAAVGAAVALSNRNIPTLTVVTDLVNVHRLWLNDSAEFCLLPTEEARRQALDAGLPDHKLVVTGIPVIPELVREQRPVEQIRAELGWRTDIPAVLVAGSKRVKSLEKYLHLFNHSALPVQWVLVAGGDDELYHYFEKTDWHGVTHRYNYVENMPALMQAADCLICKAGGLIVTEALACGLPMLLIDVTPGQEEGNADYVVKQGAAELAPEPVDALETLFHWLMDDGLLLNQRAQRAREVGLPRSAYAIADLAFRLAERGPLPVPESRLPLLPKLRDLLAQFGISTQ